MRRPPLRTDATARPADQAGRAAAPGLVALAVTLLLAGCSSAPGHDPAAVQPRQVAGHTAAPVPLGTVQRVSAASSFGPGADEVPVTISVLRFRDHILATDRAVPAAPASHWASAEVRVCRSRPVVFGYPAWVLGDDDGRTAQVSKVQRPGFPRPAFPDGSARAGCARGWVTWAAQDALHATRVSFEQARQAPGAWRLR